MNQTETDIGILAHTLCVEMNEKNKPALLQELTAAFEILLSGQVVLATSDKRIMLYEIPTFCGLSGHELVHVETKDMKHHFWIRKG